MRAKSLLWISISIASAAFLSACAGRGTQATTTAPTEEFTQPAEEPPPPPPAPANLETIYFDYDKSVIRDDQRATLASNGNTIKSRDLSRFTVEGHCDERGSDEYNLALGERRANAVKQYLVDSGITATIDTVSYGESRPAVEGHDESAWRMNRRAEFVTAQ
jgi:peptidoglycan-associated lipoprotein